MNNIISLADNSAVYDVAKVTPLSIAVQISERFGNQIYLKREDEQSIHSFKLRGAYQKMSSLSDEQKIKGVVASSAGNHAQGVALAAKKLKIRAVIVMPISTPKIKVQAVQQLGAEVILHGDVYDDAFQHANKLCSEKDLNFIHPYDDIDVIAGQATVAKEILSQLEDVDFVFVPVGGGGLISGIAAALKHANASTKVIGVEPVGASCMVSSLAVGHPVTLDVADSLADGLLPVRPGDLTFSHVQTLVDEMVMVEESAIERAVVWLCRHAKVVVEPSGAVSVAAALMREAESDSGLTVAVLSGGNIALPALVDLLKARAISPSQ